MEEVISFNNNHGQRLFGIAHVPRNTTGYGFSIGVNILNPGIKSRVAPHRLNVKLARRLCEEGYLVLRFDPTGIGDSEGEIESGQSILDIWESIQKGRFVPDVKASNRLLGNKYGLDKLFLIGNCGGAVTALLSTKDTYNISGLILIDLPITLISEGKTISLAEKIATGDSFADLQTRQYLRKLMRADSWLRLLTLRADFGAIFSVVQHIFKIKGAKVNENSLGIKSINQKLVIALESYLSKGGKILFIFAENDSGSTIMRNLFLPKYLEEHPKSIDQVTIVVIQDANHIYTLECWQELMEKEIITWLHKSLHR